MLKKDLLPNWYINYTFTVQIKTIIKKHTVFNTFVFLEAWS